MNYNCSNTIARSILVYELIGDYFMQGVVSMQSFGWRKNTSSTTNNGFVSFMLKGLQSIEVNEEYLIPNKKRKCLKDPPSCNTVY